MKRYFIVQEYFGIRLYDSKLKKEYYYDYNQAEIVKKQLEGQYTFINDPKDKQLSAPLKMQFKMYSMFFKFWRITRRRINYKRYAKTI